LLLLVPNALPQRRSSHQLRALAIVELYGQPEKPTGARLVPVAILVQEKWYDAGTYSATPRPLALDYGTVYEALREGEPAGFFTVGAARQHKGEWYGVGKWETRAELEAAEKARAAALREKTRTLEDDDGPPKLRKPGASPEPPVSSEGDTKPVSPRAEAERVRVAEPPKVTPHELDPERPTLRRGASTYGKQPLETPPEVFAGERPPAAIYIGVSDPDGTGNTRDLRFPWRPEEERTLKAKVVAMAEAELAKHLAAKKQAERSKTAPRGRTTPAKPVKLTSFQVAAYDLNTDNNAELVLTGAAGDAYITYIARTDLSFAPQKVFVSITQRDRLDAIPRMELVGAVDADARGKGELLFRLIGDGSYRYALYRVSREEATLIWKSSLYGTDYQ